jgi:hypothetical protein
VDANDDLDLGDLDPNDDNDGDDAEMDPNLAALLNSLDQLGRA